MDELSISRRLRNMDYTMLKSHFHNGYELFYLISGKSRVFVGHSLYYVEAGDMLFLLPGTLHRATYPDEEQTERVVVSFLPGLLTPLLEACGRTCMEQLFSSEKITIPVQARPALEQMFEQMEEEERAGDALSLFLQKNKVYELLAFLSKYGASRQGEPKGETECLIQQAARHICENYDKTLTLAGMADMVHMTPTYFSRRFKQVTGFGFKEYLVSVRLAQAEKLLSHTSLPVTEVALACGFGDGNYFGDTFKKCKGISPRKYRQAAKSYNLNS